MGSSRASTPTTRSSISSPITTTFSLKRGDKVEQRQLMADLVALQYRRNDVNFVRGSFRVRGDTIELWPAHLEDRAWRISLFGDEVETLVEFDPLTGAKTDEFSTVKVYANSHYVTPKPTLKHAVRGFLDTPTGLPPGRL